MKKQYFNGLLYNLLSQSNNTKDLIHFKSFLKESISYSDKKIKKLIFKVLQTLSCKIKILLLSSFENVIYKISKLNLFYKTMLIGNNAIYLQFYKQTWLPLYLNRYFLLVQKFSFFKKILLSYHKSIFFLSLSYILYYSFSIVPKGLAHLPNKVKKSTILRSPHTHKRSREQYALIYRHSVMSIPMFLGDISLLYKYSAPSIGISLTRKATLKR